MSSFFDDYADVFNSEPTPMTHCDLDAIRQRNAAMMATLAAMREARGRRNPALPLPERKVTGESQPVKPPDKRKRAPRVRVDRSPAVKP